MKKNLNVSEDTQAKNTAEILEKCDLFKPHPESNIEKIIQAANTKSSAALPPNFHDYHWKVHSLPLRIFLRITLKFLQIFYWIMTILEKIKDSDYLIWRYPPKLPEPMILILAKKKLRTLKKMMKYAEDIKNIKKENTVKGYYTYLSPWLKMNSWISSILLDILIGICLWGLIIFLTSKQHFSPGQEPERFTQFISKNFLFWVEIKKLEKQVKYTMLIFGNFKPFPLLDHFLGEILISLLYFWNFIINLGAEYHTTLLIFIFAPISLLGASFQVALAHDLFALMTSHIHTMYSFFAFVYKTTLHVLQNLFYMSRGRKYNILKGKVDEADYRIEELLFGVLMMTVIMFLLPTLLIYYFLMVYLMIITITFQSSMIILIQILTKFPIFPVIFLQKNKNSFPKGIFLSNSGNKVEIVNPYRTVL